MGVPAFYRWLSEKYPKMVQEVLEERVCLAGDEGSARLPFDCTRPNPSGLECDNLYIDMNGIIHPCSHPENGPQPTCEEEMYENVCRYVDWLFRVVRPRKLLYLAIDGVAPRAKMNQQRSRRFRSAQEAREGTEVEEMVRDQMVKRGEVTPGKKGEMWDSNVITPGTTFMLSLSEYVRFYVRKRISSDPAWAGIRVIFSDASVPGEGEHKIMSHVRLQRGQKDYDPNLVHVLHGLDADLIMLALATHEAHFYILREEVLFGRRSVEEAERKREESGHAAAQRAFDEEVGAVAMELLENKNKPLQRVSIPILRDYLENEFRRCQDLPFTGEVSFERLIDDIVFMCFFVGNDFLPHLPSLDIRDGALDYLFNVYQRLLPTLGGYLTDHGGKVNLMRVDVILAEVGAIEDYVFEMKHQNEEQSKKYRDQAKNRRKRLQKGAPPADLHGSTGYAVAGGAVPQVKKTMGRAARILAGKRKDDGGADQNGDKMNQEGTADKGDTDEFGRTVALERGHKAKEARRMMLKEKREGTGVRSSEDNARAAEELRASMSKKEENPSEDEGDRIRKAGELSLGAPSTEKQEEVDSDERDMFGSDDEDDKGVAKEDGDSPESVEVDATDNEAEDSGDDEAKQAAIEEAALKFKETVKAAKDKKLDDYSKNVVDNVRLHENGWKDRYYTDKCKADDVEENGGREHLFRCYVVGLCWVMRYYYDGCPSWKWFYPFHYAPFASDLRNIERFQKDCDALELNEPFRPVEQLMAVLPDDSSHAVPKAARWLMGDPESPIIDFYPKDVPCDPNGKAMPWLWVVLLPFIDEERLFDALKTAKSSWSNTEMLCNARGMDDGYLFVHAKHPLALALSTVMKTGKESKRQLSKLAAGKCAGFSGSIRQPLSNEIHDVDEDTIIEPPASAKAIARDSHDEVFGEPIEPNLSLCAAFTEPKKRPHLSVILPGAVLPTCILTDDDRRIRRPRLSRGGGTIAHMGKAVSHGQKAGYGSMNISSNERALAHQNGRGAQMNQTGMRPWGAMEPTPKQPRHHQDGGGRGSGGRSYMGRGSGGRGAGGRGSGGRGRGGRGSGSRGSGGYDRQPPKEQYNPQLFQPLQGSNSHQQSQQHSQSFPRTDPRQMSFERLGQTPRQQMQYQARQGTMGGKVQTWEQPANNETSLPFASSAPAQYQVQGHQQQYSHQAQLQQGFTPQQQQQGYSFQSGTHQAIHSYQQPPQPPQPQEQQQPQLYQQQQNVSGFSFNRQGEQQQQKPQQQAVGGLTASSGANPDLMSRLRSQLASTLQQNRRR